MAAEDVVVRERIAEEVGALDAAGDGRRLVPVTHERGDAGDVRVHGIADRDALARQRGVVVVHPVARFLRVEEREGQRADALLRRQMNGLAPAAGHPHGWMRPLARLGDDVARRHGDVAAGVPGERLLGEAAQRDAQALLPHGALVRRVDQKTAELGLRRRLAGAEVDAAVREQIEGRETLGHPGRMVEGRRHLDDAVPEANALGALRDRGEEHLRRARVAVLLEEVVLDLPDVVDPEPVGERALLERLLEHAVLGVGVPGARELVLVEDPELHSPAHSHPFFAMRRSVYVPVYIWQ